MFAAGIGCFVLASLLCAVAQTPGEMIAARGFQGLAEQGAASGINNVVARAATLVAVAALGRVAVVAYGPGQPGYGLPATSPEHLAATGSAFAWMSGIAAVSVPPVRRPS